MDAQGDPKLSTPTLLTHHGKKLKVTGISSVVTWKVFLFVFLVIFKFSGNENNVSFSVTSISRFGFDDWQTD